MPTAKVRTMMRMIQTALFRSVQNWKRTQMAEISAGMESQLP